MQRQDAWIRRRGLFRHTERLVHRTRRFPTQKLRNVFVVSTNDDHAAQVLTARFAPVPHEKWMRRMVRIPISVHLEVRWVFRELRLPFFVQFHCVARMREQSVHELDVRRMVIIVEKVGARMQNDHRAAFFDHWRALVQIEQISVRHDLHEQRIQKRIDVVRTDVRNARNQNVRLAHVTGTKYCS
jgi:hypothetical protein